MLHSNKYWLSAAVALWACGPGPGATRLAPLTPDEQARYQPSVADPLLALAPSGAQIVVEIDVSRLRENPVVGSLVRALSKSRGDIAGFEAFRDSDVVLYCAYQVGTAEAESLFLVKSSRLSSKAGAEAIGADVVAIGSPAMRQRVKAVEAGAMTSLRADRNIMEIRERAIPDGAPGSSLRVTANFDFEARLSLARLYNFENVPTAISVWGDVVDDLAVLALLHGEDADEATNLSLAAKDMLARVANAPLVKRLVLSYLVELVQIKRQEKAARVALVIGPRRLKLISNRLTQVFEAPEKAGPDMPAPETPAPETPAANSEEI